MIVLQQYTIESAREDGFHKLCRNTRTQGIVISAREDGFHKLCRNTRTQSLPLKMDSISYVETLERKVL